MLAGEGAIAIWNGIAPEGRADFYAWHLHEHMPERVGIPGFLRGRRYRATTAETAPEYFTLYETLTFEVTQGVDYLNRLNAPTPWTKRATSHFRTTSRSLTRVLATFGVGPGGTLLTLRFDVPQDQADAERERIADLLLQVSRMPEITGAHLLRADVLASGARTAESKDRTDIELPANWVILIEGCSEPALRQAVKALTSHPAIAGGQIGVYLHEYTRLKTAGSIG
jgi:hypothetical protein